MLKLLTRFSDKAFLCLLIVISLAPFLDLRVLRMAGDEKVYVSQAIEMARRGDWFVQTLAGEPNYFKGPAHYILVRVGMLVFGDHLVAGLWMNLAFMLLSAFALYKLGRKYLSAERSMLLALAGTLNVGIFSHALASQMEVEISALCALAMMFLGTRDGEGFKVDAPFWITVGIAGWVKSPAHCVLMGGSGILYWLVTGQALRKLKSPGSWLAALAGVAICVAGYLPYVFLDWFNFREFYIMRENVTKPDNNRAWHYVVAPLIHFALPWTALVALGFLRFPVMPKPSRKLFALGLAWSIPTILFWSLWRYKGQNYNLPVMSGLIVAGIASFKENIPRLAWQLIGLIGLAAFFAILVLVFHFWPLPDWWKWGWVLLSLAAILVFSACFLFASDERVIGVGAMLFFIAFGAFITPLGQREMRDLRSFAKAHPEITLHYDDLDPSIWSEWGLLQFVLHRPVFGLHKPEDLPKITKPGNAFLTATDAGLERAKHAWEQTNAESESPSKEPLYKIEPWRRWMTKGKSPEGKPMWREAWDAHDLSLLERRFHIFWIPTSPASTL